MRKILLTSLFGASAMAIATPAQAQEPQDVYGPIDTQGASTSEDEPTPYRLPTGLELPKDANTQEGQFGTDDGRLSYVLKKAETTQYDLYVGRQDSLDKKIREISGTQDLQRRPRGVSAGVSVAFGF